MVPVSFTSSGGSWVQKTSSNFGQAKGTKGPRHGQRAWRDEAFGWDLCLGYMGCIGPQELTVVVYLCGVAERARKNFEACKQLSGHASFAGLGDASLESDEWKKRNI